MRKTSALMAKNAALILSAIAIFSCYSCGTAQTKTRVSPSVAGPAAEKKEHPGSPTTTEGGKPEARSAGTATAAEKFSSFVASVKTAEKAGDPGRVPEGWKEFIGTPFEREAHMLSCSLLELEDPREAEECYREHLERYGQRTLPLGRILAMKMETGDLKAAKAIVEELEKDSDTIDNPDIFLQLASYYVMRRKPDKAEKYLRKAEIGNAAESKRVFIKAQIALIRGNEEAAMEILEDAGTEAKKKPEYVLMISYLNREFPRVEPEELPPYLRPYLAHAKAQTLIDAGSLDEAEKLLTGWLEKNPGDATARLLLGNVYFEKSLFKNAFEQYQKAKEADPDLKEAYLNIGIVSEIYLGLPDVAKESYRKYIELGGARSKEVERWLKALELMSGKR